MMKFVDRVCIALYFMGAAVSLIGLAALCIFFSPVLLFVMGIGFVTDRATEVLERKERDKVS